MKVVIAVDQTEYSTQIIDAVINGCWPPDTCFKVLTVLETSQASQAEVVSRVLRKSREKIENSVATSTVHIDLRHGNAKDEIIKAAVEWMPDKIVLGTHGQAPNRLLGSLPRAVSRLAPCSVELIRLKEPMVEAIKCS